MNSLEERVVIVTGASSGIGAATARALAKAGCRVVLAARSAEKLERLAAELGPTSLPVPTDVTVGEEVERMVERSLERFGRVDALLANAGVYLAGNVFDGDPDAWASLLDVNINGVLRCVRAVLPGMMAQGEGDIIITSSISGLEDIVWEPVYSASKHAVRGLTHTLRREVMKSGVRVGAVAPGRVANELWGVTESEEVAAQVEARESLRSEDVAEVILFMLSRPRHVTLREVVMLPQRQDL